MSVSIPSHVAPSRSVSDNAFDPDENANIPTVAYELPDGQVRSVAGRALGCWIALQGRRPGRAGVHSTAWRAGRCRP